MFKDLAVGQSKSAVLIVPVFAEPLSVAAGVDADEASRQAVDAALNTAGFKAEPGETRPAEDVVLLGLGRRDDLTTDALRVVGARLVKALDRMDAKAVRFALSEDVADAAGTNAGTVGRCLAEGMGLGNWRVDAFDGEATKKDPRKAALKLDATDREVRAGLKTGLELAASTNYARGLAATPPNICNPQWIADEAKKMARKVGLTCRVISFKQAEELGMGGLVNVGKGSAHKPRLIILEHKPTTKKSGKPVALVGKTITFDTGGYSLKVGGSMKGMKSDKNGGMAVLGAMHAIATLDLPVHVVALLPAAENMVSAEAYRVDDIITMYNGATVEVTNTDAEGRLVLADALAYACDKVKPRAIIDAATLTGGVVVALGHFCAGLFCNDDGLRGAIETAADETGEKVWRLPLWEDHRDFMRARHADLWNSAPARSAHPIQGAAFLSFFVDHDVPWAHLDIAGVNDVDSDKDLYVAGPTGYGVRLLAEAVSHYAKA